jgi:hypothetical protein
MIERKWRFLVAVSWTLISSFAVELAIDVSGNKSVQVPLSDAVAISRGRLIDPASSSTVAKRNNFLKRTEDFDQLELFNIRLYL